MTEAVSGRFRVEVLGPVRVRAPDGVDLTPAGALPRRLLALLMLRRGRTVTADVAVEALWPGERPHDPVAALHNHVSRLRRALPGAIESVPDGYRLDPGLVDVDADRLAAAVGGDAADPASRSTVDEILARWHGPAYPELDDVDEARAESLRVDELRVRARERVAESRFAAGDTDGLAAELRAVVDEHPLREHPRALLMEVLAATGRHADALRIYDELRRLLADELGVEPSPALAARHQALLAGAGIGEWTPERRLPVPPTSLVGRNALVRELVAALSGARLLTLVGPGGVGKTRMLLEIGHRTPQAGDATPVVLCELARAGEGTAVETVAAALRVDDRPGAPLPERVAGVIGDAPLVLLLDNCEHVLEPVTGLVDLLLARCPEVRIVATSRERLRVAGERVRTVPPLAVGDADAPATRLFVERAAAAGALAVDGEALARVEHIVERLDGLPLAIELAAARMHSHDVDEIAAGLDARFDFLTSGYRTSSRHGSLGAAVSWSFDMLDGPLKQTFADLSVFTGPFELSGAATVCGLDRAEAGDQLSRLVERSLVMRYPGRRYVLLETLRAFGSEQLGTADRRDAVGGRHAQYMVGWVEQSGRNLALPGTGAVAQIDDAVPELQRALDWLIDHDDPESAGRIVAALLDYGLLRLRPDVLAWAARVSEADPDDRSAFAALVRSAGAYAAWMAGDLTAAGQEAQRARKIADAAGGAIPAQVYGANGVYELFAGRLGEAADWYGRAARVAAEAEPAYWPIPAGTEIMVRGYLGDPVAPEMAAELVARTGDSASPYAAYAWYCAGEAVLDTDPRLASERLERAMRLADLTRAAFVAGVAGASKASLDVRLGDHAEAASAYRGLIRHWQRAGMWSTQWVMLRSIAVLLDHLGRHRDAAVLEGAIRAAPGHVITGADEVTLTGLSGRLRAALGDESYEAALREGAALDSDALLEHTLRAL